MCDLIQGCSKLEILKMNKLRHVSEICLKKLSKNCNNLKHLSFIGVPDYVAKFAKPFLQVKTDKKKL